MRTFKLSVVSSVNKLEYLNLFVINVQTGFRKSINSNTHLNVFIFWSIFTIFLQISEKFILEGKSNNFVTWEMGT